MRSIGTPSRLSAPRSLALTGPSIITSGTGVLTSGRLATEDTAPASGSVAIPRVSKPAALAIASQGVRTSVVCLPPSVHGDGDHGFVPILIGISREKAVFGVYR